MSGVNPKDIIGSKKVSLFLIPAASKIYQAVAMEDGAKKYGPYNWRDKQVQLSVYLSALERHMEAFKDGEEVASDSGLPHLAHAIANIGIIIDALESGCLIDDRPVKGSAGKLIERFTKKAPNERTTLGII